jgi:MYXO-CTERM domain-containing protein
VGFSFSQQIGPGALLPGTNSAVLVIQTNATDFQNALANIIDSGAISVLSFAPVPEPTMLGLAGVGVLVLIRRRR